MSIVRDATFSQVVADHVLVTNLGRDYELAMLQIGSQPNTMAFFEQDGKIVNQSQFMRVATEVVRVRMSPDSAAQMAMHILENLILANQVVNDMVLDNIKNMISNAQTEKSQ